MVLPSIVSVARIPHGHGAFGVRELLLSKQVAGYCLMLNDEKRDGERGDLHHAALCANSDLDSVPHSVNLGAHGATARRQLRWPVERQL